MNSTARWFSDSDLSEWTGALSARERELPDVFSLPSYLRLNAKPGSEPAAFLYEEGDRYFSFSFLVNSIVGTVHSDITNAYGFGRHQSNTDDHEFLGRAYRLYRQQAIERGVIAELVKFHPLFHQGSLLTSYYGGSVTRMRDVVVVTTDVDETTRWEKIYSHANRKNIKKALRMGLAVREAKDEAAWQRFAVLYHETMTQNQASSFYFFDAAYFAALRRDLSDNSTLLEVRHEERTVASLLVLFDRDCASCHLLGNSKEYFAHGVNNLVYHHAIEWVKSHRIPKLILGGGRTNAPDDSLLLFKQNFSNEAVPFLVGESVFDPVAYARICEHFQCPAGESGNLLSYRANPLSTVGAP